jgi:hypothetical protein
MKRLSLVALAAASLAAAGSAAIYFIVAGAAPDFASGEQQRKSASGSVDRSYPSPMMGERPARETESRINNPRSSLRNDAVPGGSWRNVSAARPEIVREDGTGTDPSSRDQVAEADAGNESRRQLSSVLARTTRPTESKEGTLKMRKTDASGDHERAPQTQAGAASTANSSRPPESPESSKQTKFGEMEGSAREPVRKRSRHAWPKPLDAESERFRQQLGVQSFVDWQYDVATGRVAR